MSGNTATTRGGAIWSDSGLTIENTTISNNTSKEAGGIYLTSSAMLNLGGTSTISGNASTEHGGGGIDNYDTVVITGNVTITGNSCHGNGAGIWTNGTLRMAGNIQIKNNTGDDLYLKKGSVVDVTGALTGGAASIMVRMEGSRGKLTSGYTSSGTSVQPFAALQDDINKVSIEDDGECYLLLGYYECSWDVENQKVNRTLTWIDRHVAVDNLCSAKYASGGGLDGDNYVFVVDGTATIPNGLTVAGHSKVILFDGSSLTVGDHGIKVNRDASLRIYGQKEGTGKLIATGDYERPAIGGEQWDARPGGIEIHGGYVEAHGGESATGIGGAAFSPGGFLIIYGGTVKAYGGDDSAAIGCGYKNTEVGDITIFGGDVYAEGGANGAGIGTGHTKGNNHKVDGVLTVYGGTVNAVGGYSSAGIGGGDGRGGFTVNVHGGKVYAWGGSNGAGIGSGYNAKSNLDDHQENTFGGVLTVTGGIVDAEGGRNGAGIGGGYDSSGGGGGVSGGTVRATGGNNAAGIGGGSSPYFGRNTHGGTVTVTGGTVIAKGIGWGAGIGGGANTKGATVVIKGAR